MTETFDDAEDFEIEDYALKIDDFSKWLHRQFVVDGCGDPKVDGCLSCEAVLAIESLSAMVRIIVPSAPSPPHIGTTVKDWKNGQ